MNDIYLSLGSNMGDRAANLAAARHRLSFNNWVTFVQCSPVVESSPWGVAEQAWYLNQVCHCRTPFSVTAVMRWLRTVEMQGGRDRTNEERWGPRVIDIDLLAYNDEVYSDHNVTVPHPEVQNRRFVLEPWALVAPNWQHPKLKKSVMELASNVNDDGVVRYWNG